MKKTIVVADDFDNTRLVINVTLKKLDLEILEACDGMEALKYFDGRNIDLLITDFNMPNMNGGDLVKKVRNMEKYAFIPTLILTTERDEDKKADAIKSKVTAWIQKPFKNEDFVPVVKKCLRIS